MNFEQFKKLTKSYNLIPVYEIITADLLTPVLAYIKLRQIGQLSFLLESVEGENSIARYSFIGVNPVTTISNKGNTISIKTGDNLETIKGNIFDLLEEIAKKHKQPTLKELPVFTGGYVGYLGYENISLIENSIKLSPITETEYDSIFGLYQTVVAFDHLKHQLILISNVLIDKNSDYKLEYQNAKKKIKKIKDLLKKQINYKSDFSVVNFDKDKIDASEFYSRVNKSKERIEDGDVYQIVISERFSASFNGDPFNVYRALRIINPSPYMYYLEFENNFTITGTSPEDLVKVIDGKAQVLPIAGTRKRGDNEYRDSELENELLNDPKELAEHTMLVDLGRNDLGKVCQFNSVNVVQDKIIQRYSHVMHIVSKVEGQLLNNKSSVDALKSCFPAGTVTGAPKLKAIELINNYENIPRGVYAGAIGYLDFSGNLDMCIAIRTLYSVKNKIFWQAGAGIVYDSKPELELKEIYNKSAVLKKALIFAEVIDESISN
ncbi:MAG: chorismate-binding protein [Bacteroidetes bacterium]|nr:chorismate-binding protein [Bacteroidota bacterium]